MCKINWSIRVKTDEHHSLKIWWGFCKVVIIISCSLCYYFLQQLPRKQSCLLKFIFFGKHKISGSINIKHYAWEKLMVFFYMIQNFLIIQEPTEAPCRVKNHWFRVWKIIYVCICMPILHEFLFFVSKSERTYKAIHHNHACEVAEMPKSLCVVGLRLKQY